jgi:lysophospholipase L1-like esterase
MRTSRSRILGAALALVLVLTAGFGAAQPPETDDGTYFFFKDGDRIVVMGDSITEQHLYSNYLEMWSVCRFPKRNLTFRNVGIGGDRSPGGNSRFKRDVLAHEATVLTVDFGMNDGYALKFDKKSFQTYLNGLQGIADQAKAAKIRVAWITPQPIENREPGPVYQGVNQNLERFSEGVQEIAAKNGGIFVDQFHPYLAVLAKARATDPKNTNITAGDPVHPGPPGQVVMAAAILKILDFQRLVSRLVLDAKTEKVLEVENCQAEILAKEDGVLRFTRLDFALPFFPAEADSIRKWTPILEDMNRYGLKVMGLTPGSYALHLDKQKVAVYSAEELAQGVNIAGPALSAGPIADQVKKVWTAVKNKNKYFHDQIFRGVVLAPAKSAVFKDVDPADIEAKRLSLYAERMKKMTELDADVRRAVEVKEHTVQLVPLKK